jgi:hypothetical protein
VGLALASCSSDDVADPAAESTTTTTTTTTPAALPTATTTTTTTTTTTSTASTTTTTTAPDQQAGDAAGCLVGAWLLDGPQWVANSVAVIGEPVSYSSGSYVYTFSDDGTFAVEVNDFTIIIEGEDEPVRVASNGSEQGTWIVVSDPAEVADLVDIDPPDLPHVIVETTSVSVSETGFARGETIPFGLVDQDQGLDGVGPLDCDEETMVIRGTVPLAIDYPFTRM